jgi:hypothetical protein
MNASESPLGAGFTLQPQSAQSVFRPMRPTQADQVLSLETAEQGVTLHVGEYFSINFGEKRWNMRIRDEVILASDGNGRFRALRGGKTKVIATSEPPQNDSGPPRSARAKLFIEIPVVVMCS